MKWISVKDRLPDGGYKLCLAWTNGFLDGLYPQIVSRSNGVWGDPVLDDLEFDDESITHWMPLPEPPTFCDKCNDTHQIDVEGGLTQCNDCR